MQTERIAATGSVYLYSGKRGAAWYARLRLPGGKTTKRAIGPAWPERGGDPPSGHYTRRLAERELRRMLDEVELEDHQPVESGATFEQAVQEYLRYCEQERDHKSSTLYATRCVAKNLEAEFAGPIERVTAKDIESFKRKRLATVKARTVQVDLIVLNGIFKAAMREFGLRSNPMSEIERPRQRDTDNITPLSMDEVRALLEAAEDGQERALFTVAIYSGLRRGEIIGLRWGDLDFSGNGTLLVRRSIVNGVIDLPKSNKERAVPMAPSVKTVLLALRQREDYTGPDDYIFVSEDGEPLIARTVIRAYDRALKRAKISKRRFHDLRHTFCSLAIKRADIRKVQAWAGHSSVAITAKYLHHKPEDADARLLALAFEDDEPGLRAA